MSEAKTATLIEMTSEIVAAYVTKNHVHVAELPELISTIHAALSGMGGAPEAAPESAKLVPAVPIKKSITEDFMICLEDGRKLKSLKRHLQSVYGLSPERYRAKWGLPHDYPMVAPGYSARRSELAKSIGLGSLRKTG